MSWEPDWTPQEQKDIPALQQRIQKRDKDLKELVGENYDAKFKWNWPKEAKQIVEDARKDALIHHDLVTRHLKELYTWPSPEQTDDHVFIEGKEPNSMFSRKEDWFDTEGFHKFETSYTFSNRWDKAIIPVTFLVPKNIPAKPKAPVMW
jgi:hypothetical protein